MLNIRTLFTTTNCRSKILMQLGIRPHEIVCHALLIPTLVVVYKFEGGNKKSNKEKTRERELERKKDNSIAAGGM